MSRWIAWLALCSALTASLPALARQETGFLDRSIIFHGVEYRYAVFVPRDWSPARRWPVILALHGGGTYGTDGLTSTEGALGRAIKLYPERYPAIVVFPHGHADGLGWQGPNGEVALEEMSKALTEFHGDPSRLYLTGFSAGGNGVWWLAYHHPGRFAAALIVSGWVTPFTGRQSHIAYPSIAPVSAGDAYAAVAKGVGPLPIWLAHGDADQTVSVEESRNMFAALKAAGDDVLLTELPGLDHNATWDPVYQNPAVAMWLFDQRRR
ncbi:MAG TPA: prolyl oligopeptidase family serine peptidase [Phenylobacterium sp.]|nr:prolyl oligopeptidase family serine peptidase [Phenylobacterium sp.]